MAGLENGDPKLTKFLSNFSDYLVEVDFAGSISKWFQIQFFFTVSMLLRQFYNHGQKFSNEIRLRKEFFQNVGWETIYKDLQSMTYK